MAVVAIVGGSEETRLLLRGLLRLYRHRVVGEGPTFAAIPPGNAPDSRPTAVVADLDLDDPEAQEALARARRDHPSLRIVVLTSHRTPRIESKAHELGADSVIRRPFAVRELMEAVEAPPPATLAPPGVVRQS